MLDKDVLFNSYHMLFMTDDFRGKTNSGLLEYISGPPETRLIL